MIFIMHAIRAYHSSIYPGMWDINWDRGNTRMRSPSISDGVRLIVSISNMRLKNARLAISRRISQLGYADRVKAVIQSRKLLLIRLFD